MAKRKKREAEGQWVSIDEQEAQGLRRPRPQGQGQFVEPERKQEIIKLPNRPEQSTYIEVAPTVRSVVDVRTSHVDRAKGFNIVIAPFACVVGFLATMYAVAFKDYPLFSLVTGVYFFTWFAVIWVIGFLAINVLLTPEFAGLLDMLFKWLYLFKERDDTWRHYRGKK